MIVWNTITGELSSAVRMVGAFTVDGLRAAAGTVVVFGHDRRIVSPESFTRLYLELPIVLSPRPRASKALEVV